MSRRALALALIGALSLAACGLPAGSPQEPLSQAAPPETQAAAVPLNPCNYWDSATLEAHAATDRRYTVDTPLAAVVPHYAPELEMLAALLASAGDHYDTVVVIGPDHVGKGGGIALSGRGWDTPYGVLSGSDRAAQALLASGTVDARQNHALLAEDHAVATLIPYVARWLPQAQVAGVLLGRHTDRQRLEALADTLCQLALETRLLVLFSVDFAHYQRPQDIPARDRETREIIESGDIPALLRLESSNLDSPECMAAFVLLAQRSGLVPRYLDGSVSEYLENGVPQAGSFMVWAADGMKPD